MGSQLGMIGELSFSMKGYGHAQPALLALKISQHTPLKSLHQLQCVLDMPWLGHQSYITNNMCAHILYLHSSS